ncbi:MAG: peptidoglycan DD-metalloendopeptidase family protein [Bacteroidales bacterium]|nr:peptidoglycan DD-metalloendopeptidase family protein [Bacteroidales bacterium]
MEDPQDTIPAIGFRFMDLVEQASRVHSGETFGAMMVRLGMPADSAHALTGRIAEVFDVRKLRADNPLLAYYSDSTMTDLRYVVYPKSKISSVVFSCADSLAAWTYDKPTTKEQRYSDVMITSSLWNDMKAAGASPLLIVSLEDVFAWSVDFFGLQEGDCFQVVYAQTLCEDEVVSIDTLKYAVFSRGEKQVHAIRYDQGDGGNKYWNEKGESLKKAFLKAPLQFTRISSGFSYHRKHPVTGKVKPHTAVDYAAPAGTPVVALGDGTVQSAGWAGGGGNTIKIKHNGTYTTGYLHLSRFAKGIKAGVHVRQGQTIGYVGSTGVSTGPHLDFRVWKNGTPVNPLTLESPSAEPIKSQNKPSLDSVFVEYKALMDSLSRR